MAQTAVDFLVKKFHDYGTMYYSDIAEAKAMEKEQIQDAYASGSNDRLRNRVIEYYNEKYGGNK